MAVLTVDSLTGCGSIPSFLGGSGDTPSNPSIMIFHQSNAPTPWTKDTSAGVNNIGLRVIGAPNGTPITTGGSLPFTQTFASRSVGPQNTGSQNIIGTQITQTSVTLASPVTGGADGYPFATQSTTLSTQQTPPHTHPFPRYQASTTISTNVAPAVSVSSSNQTAGTTGAPSVAASGHTHPISAPHTHGISVSAHSHNSSPTAQGNHLHAYSGSYDFSINYVDVIIATKN
jgi:hypothetical protein